MNRNQTEPSVETLRGTTASSIPPPAERAPVLPCLHQHGSVPVDLGRVRVRIVHRTDCGRGHRDHHDHHTFPRGWSVIPVRRLRDHIHYMRNLERSLVWLRLRMPPPMVRHEDGSVEVP